MATSNRSRRVEKKAAELFSLAAGAGAIKLGRADRSALEHLSSFADRMFDAHSDLALSAGGAEGATTALAERLATRYITDDMVGPGDMRLTSEAPVSRHWGASGDGYWGLGEVDPIVVMLEDDPDLFEEIAESVVVRRRVRQSMFSRQASAATGGRATRGAARRAATQNIAAGRPARPPLWQDSDSPTLVAPGQAESAGAPTAAAGKARRERRSAAAAPTTPAVATPSRLDYRYPYPRGLGQAGARFIPGVNRRAASFGVASNFTPEALEGAARALAMGRGARSGVPGAGGPFMSGPTPFANDSSSSVGQFAFDGALVAPTSGTSSFGYPSRRDAGGARGISLDGLSVGRTAMAALSSALLVADAAFGPAGTPMAGVVGPTSVDRSLGIIRLSDRQAGGELPQRSAAEGGLDVAYVELGNESPEPVRAATRASRAGHGQTRRVSLFDVVPSAPRLSDERRAASSAGTSTTRSPAAPATAFGMELPAAERFSLQNSASNLNQAARGRWEQLAILGDGWTSSGATGAASSVSMGVAQRSGATARLAGALPRRTTGAELVAADGSVSGAVDTVPGAAFGPGGTLPPGALTGPTSALLRPGMASAADVLLSFRGSATARPSTPAGGLRQATGMSARPSSMGQRVAGILAAVATSPEDASALLGAWSRLARPDGAPLGTLGRDGAVRVGRYAEAEALLLQMASEASTGELAAAGRVLDLRATGREHSDRASTRTRRATSDTERALATGHSHTQPAIGRSSGAVQVSVRLPSGALVPVSLGTAPGGRAPAPGDAFQMPAIRVVLPAGTEHALAETLPRLVEAVGARQLRGAMSAATTDVGRAFALGLPESVVASLRSLSDNAASSAEATLASYTSLLRTAPELDVLGLDALTAEGGAPGLTGPARAGVRRPSAAASTAPGRGGIVGIGELRTVAAASAVRAASGAPGVPATAGAAAGAERLGWTVTGSRGGGLTLELVDRVAAPAGATAAGASFVRMPDGRLVPAAVAHVTTGAARGGLGASALLTPAAQAARAGLAFSDQRLAALGFGEGADAGRAMQLAGGRDPLDLLSIQDVTGGTPEGAEALGRDSRGIVRSMRLDDAAHGGQRGMGSRLPDEAGNLDLVSMTEHRGEEQRQQLPGTRRSGGLASAARKAESFRPVGARSSSASPGERSGAASPSRGAERGRSGAGSNALFGADQGRRAGARSGGAPRRPGPFGFDGSLGEELVRMGQEGPAASRSSDGSRGEDRRSSLSSGRTSAGGASSDPFGAWGGVSSLIRRLSDGGSASPAQRELASLIDALPTSASIREGGGFAGTTFSRDLLVRLETAIDTLSGGRSTKEMVSAIRTGGGGVSTTRVSDLGSDSLMSLVSPVLGADPFKVGSAASHGVAGGPSPRGAARGGSAPGASASGAAPAQALDGMDWNLVTPHAASTEAGRTAPDLGRLARTALSSGGVKRADLPLIAPATMAVAQHAQLSAREDAKPEAAAPANAGKPDAKKTAEAKVDLDKLAVEMANRISIRSRLELERRGIWRTS